MGLDVTGYSNVTLVEAVSLKRERDKWNAAQDTHGGEWRSIVCVYEAGFPERMTDLKEGFYRFGECHRFCAGSYGGYNRWREYLAAAVGTIPEHVWRDKPTDLPFYELINFSDCEGGIGPSVCAKLRDDFERERARVAAWAEGSLDDNGRRYFADVYEHFARAFALGANNGFVKFH